MADVGYASVSRAPPPATSIEEDTDEYWSLGKCKRAYTDYVGTKREEIDEQQNARRYRHGAQWTSTQIEVFNKRKQPVVTYNRIGRKIDAIVGLMEKLRMDPKGFPRNPRTTDEKAAELATACIRYAVESGLKESLFPFSIEMAATDGIGGVEMLLDSGDRGDPDISFAKVQIDSFFYDPRSFEHDFSDARFMGQGKWLDLDDVKALFPDKSEEIEGSMDSGADLTSSPDRERHWFDVDKDHKRIRVVDIWYKHKGGWCWCMFTGSMKLDEGQGYFYDEKNAQICKYIMFSSFVDHDGDRYGFVRNLRSSQDEINQRRSKGLHELVSRRVIAEDGAFTDIEVTRRELIRPDGVVLRNKGFEAEFDDQARHANVEGQLKFLEDAKNEIENFGPNPALIGQGLEYKSGRAINLLQQAGIAELGPFVIGIKNWKLRLYRAIWSAQQRYWTAERWIRVTDDEGIAQFIQLNGVGIDPESGFPTLVNGIGQLDVNFVLEEGPDEVNMMADAYDTLVALTAQGANIPPQVLLELAPLHGSVKRKLLALLGKPDQAMETAKLVAIKGEQAKMEESQARTEEIRSRVPLNMAKAQEIAQGGAHGVVERQIDAQMREREAQLREREVASKVQGKAAETQVKLQGERELGRLRVGQEIIKTRATAAQAAQKMRQQAQAHQLKMRQQAAKPKPNGGSNATR